MDSEHFSSILLFIQFSSLTATSIVALSIACILLYLSALLSATITALQTLNVSDKNEIEKDHSHQAHTIQIYLSRFDEVQTGLSLWKIFCHICLIILCFYSFRQFILFSNPPIGVLFTIVFLIFVIVLMGEVIPQLYAKNNPFQYLRKISPLLYILDKVTYPLSSMVIKTAGALRNHFQKRVPGDVSVDELSKALELTSNELTEEKNMLKGIINLYNKTAAEIMTPRMDIANLDVAAKFKEVMAYIVKVEYSRIPVYSGNADNVKGILYIKDLLPYLNQENNFHWQKLIRPAFFIPESKKIDDLLEEFRTKKSHIAIVVDEYGGTSGIVTMEDILEEIVGEINDEYDDDEHVKYSRQQDGSLIFEGKILLTDFFRITGIDSKVFSKLTEEIDTLAGLILEIKGDFPVVGEIIRYQSSLFEIMEMNNKRILKIKFTREENEIEHES